MMWHIVKTVHKLDNKLATFCMACHLQILITHTTHSFRHSPLARTTVDQLDSRCLPKLVNPATSWWPNPTPSLPSLTFHTPLTH